MPARRTLGLVLLALAVSGPATARAPGPSPQVVISRCTSKAPATLKGLSALHAACPGIGRAIAGLGLGAFLPPHWRQALTPRALAGLAALARRYGGSPLTPLPDPATLHAIALTLKPPPPPPSWWARVKTWAGRWTAPLRRMIDGWLHSLAGTANGSALPILFILGGLVLLAVVVVVVVMELRSCGLIGSGRRRHARTDAVAPSDEATATGAPDWNTLRERPARLLRVLVEALIHSRRIERNRHLTCLEISTRARFDSARQREDFLHVARLAERELYGPGAPAPVPDATLRAARVLRSELLSAPAPGEAGAL